MTEDTTTCVGFIQLKLVMAEDMTIIVASEFCASVECFEIKGFILIILFYKSTRIFTSVTIVAQ